MYVICVFSSPITNPLINMSQMMLAKWTLWFQAVYRIYITIYLFLVGIIFFMIPISLINGIFSLVRRPSFVLHIYLPVVSVTECSILGEEVYTMSFWMTHQWLTMTVYHDGRAPPTVTNRQPRHFWIFTTNPHHGERRTCRILRNRTKLCTWWRRSERGSVKN